MPKDHETRRREIIGTAQNLFFTRGYDAVPIADIISAVGIAKGTFYHYFRSKDQLLEGIIELYTERIIAQVEPIAADDTRSARERVGNYFRQAFSIKSQSPEMLRLGLEQIYRPENTLMRVRMIDRSARIVAPHLAEMISDGNRQGEFSVPDPHSCADFVYRSFASISEEIAGHFLAPASARVLQEETERLLDFMEWSFARLLGIEGDPLCIADREDLRSMIEAFTSMEETA